jgi:hypothetical protein
MGEEVACFSCSETEPSVSVKIVSSALIRNEKYSNYYLF